MSKSAPQIDLPGLRLDRDRDCPLHQQLYAFLRTAIEEGRLQPNRRLPATRTLASEWGISRNVVMLAFEQLLLEGYLVAKTGSGTYVAPQNPTLLPEQPLVVPTPQRNRLPNHTAFQQAIPQHTGCFVPEKFVPFQTSVPSLRDFPFPVWSRLAAQVYRELHLYHLSYGNPAGYLPLREAIAKYVQVNRAVRCSPEQVIIVQGTQQALYLAGALLLRPGDPFWMEDPGYATARTILTAAGGVACPVPVGREGIDLDFAISQYPEARVAYVTPSHQYPMGGTLPYPTRKCLLQWAEQHEGWIIEDDYDSELRYSGKPLPSLQGMDQAGRVVYIGTFSKTLFPALRMAYLILPDAQTAHAFTRGKALLDQQSPLVEQLILTRFMEEGHFERHIRRMRQLYSHRQALLASLLEKLPALQTLTSSDAGMNLLAWLPETVNDQEVSAMLAQHGIVAPALSNYTLQHRQPPALVLGYAAFTDQQITKAAERLAGAFAQCELLASA
ncbi:GntR family transcriptional regulator / MocR family aminotransferase [Catalinimonas alkaloidigena]|uniref:GntR family transcriptional regulator / MocR family aminotransferase n=1 Tax=Catalinimonas alkaloidigena TaxID=1075417 RepID=A0A1G9PNI2_9BACT|nr:PLP-dependent aminotransferase family protein [Catalinimonas alkaloidigena]SDM00366.1 GntR family transcriptional regulator / MocR family aminotransferase [Catalinimonas alkaloidigena]